MTALLVWVLGVLLAWVGTPRARTYALQTGRAGLYWAYVLAWPYTLVAAIVWHLRGRP